MRKVHHETLRVHTIFNTAIASLYILIVAINIDMALVISTVFLLIYVTGNGIIHSKKNQLTRDTLVEYIILAVIALVILGNALTK